MSTKTLTKSDLAHFTGTEHWYRHNLVRRVVYTDGVKYVAEKGGAYWLIDEIALGQTKPRIAEQPFQVWKLKLDEGGSSAMLTVEDGNGNEVSGKRIEFTDFPLPEITIWAEDGYVDRPCFVVMLPSER